MNIRSRFFPQQPPTHRQLQSSRRIIVAEGAIAAIIFSIATGNFLAGYLTYLGASISFCAAVAMIPQYGCILQFVSPFLFERFHHRKLSVWLLCMLFRFSIAFMILVPLFLQAGNVSLGAAFLLYVIGFSAAGLVTPGLQHMILGLAPMEHRGTFFARKDIVAICINSVATLVLGRQLDYFTKKGDPFTGFLILGIVCLVLAALDGLLLFLLHEQPVEFATKMQVKDILNPLKDKKYRPILYYIVVGGLMNGIASPFLSVYQLRVLNLSHTFITSAGVAAAVGGMVGTYAWGRFAERTHWARIVQYTAFISLVCTLGWAFVPQAQAHIFVPILLVVSALSAGGAGIASINLQYFASPERGKTLYIGVTSALGSLAICFSAAVSTTFQPALEQNWQEKSIPILFLLAGIGGLVNLFINGRKLPETK